MRTLDEVPIQGLVMMKQSFGGAGEGKEERTKYYKEEKSMGGGGP